jgi:hypothetical protein
VLGRLSLPLSVLGRGRFSMKVVVDERSDEPLAAPHFRGMHHVVTASFGGSNVFVFDVLRRTLNASISAVVARDIRFWKEKVIPISLGVLGAAMGLVPVHCACLESGGDGLLIAGESGAGKSTLSVALTESGFNYVSDDWTYLSEQHDQIIAYGTSAPVKLLPDATKHFENLSNYSLQTSMNGELAYEVDIAEAFSAKVERKCEPRWFLFLERTQEAGSEFTPMSSTEAKTYVDSSVEKLPVQLSDAAETREKTITRVSRLPCWRFRYGGTPQFAAKQLREFVINRHQEVYV